MSNGTKGRLEVDEVERSYVSDGFRPQGRPEAP